MFLRKLTVIAVPLLLLTAVCLLWEWIQGLGFFGNVIKGALLGLALALLLPLSGARRQRNRFARLLWIPCAALALTVAYQYLASIGQSIPALRFLETQSAPTVLAESAFFLFLLISGFFGERE